MGSRAIGLEWEQVEGVTPEPSKPLNRPLVGLKAVDPR